MSDFKRTTIVFPVKDTQVLLGMKKRGFGAGWWNGFGGKLDEGETYEDSAKRETEEEVCIKVSDLRLVARLLFYFNDELEFGNLVFITENYEGEPTETEEMRPEWFDISKLPFDKMWPGDEAWIPDALKLKGGDTPLDYSLYFDENNKFLKIATPDPQELIKVFDSEQ